MKRNPGGLAVALGGSEGMESPEDTAISPDDVFDVLRTRILHGELRPGTSLSQVQLAADLGVSRTPLREAIRRLQAEGLITAERNRQARVSPIDADELEAFYSARIQLESLAVYVTVPKLTAKDLSSMAAALEHLRGESDSYETWATAHRRFHTLAASHVNAPMREILRNYEQRTERYRRILLYEPADTRSWQTSYRQHSELFAACTAGDANAARRLIAHHLGVQALNMMISVDPAREPSLLRAAVRVAVEPK